MVETIRLRRLCREFDRRGYELHLHGPDNRRLWIATAILPGVPKHVRAGPVAEGPTLEAAAEALLAMIDARLE